MTIVKTAPAPVNFTGGSFVGTYNPFAITDANRKSIVLLAAGNKLGYAKTDRTLGAFRAYFDMSSPSPVRSFELNFGEGEGTTGIKELKDSRIEELTLNNGWYTLGGVKLQGEPTEKGIYIYNGKKVVK